jgi:hypothetical protein
VNYFFPELIVLLVLLDQTIYERYWQTLICARFQVLMVARMKMTAFRDMAPCSLVEADQCFRDAYCLHHQGKEYRPDDGGSTHL